MKTTTLAVFGHYDSRGGTSAYPLPESPSAKDLSQAIRSYAADCWGDEKYALTSAIDDFLFVARLHQPDIEPETSDLEEAGSVLIDTATEPSLPSFESSPIPILDGRACTEALAEAFAPDAENPEANLAELVEAALAVPPTELEFVPFDSRKYDEDHPFPQRPSLTWSRTDTEEEVARKQAIVNEGTLKANQWDSEREAHIKGLAQVLKGETVEVRRWDDDAYGFLICG